jgi:hypothetical protein
VGSMGEERRRGGRVDDGGHWVELGGAKRGVWRGEVGAEVVW